MNEPAAKSPLDSAELERRLDALRRLLDVTGALAAEVDQSRLLATIAHSACEALDCERASVYRYDAATDELYTTTATRLEVAEIRKPADRGISGWVARQRKLANVTHPAADPRWDSAIDVETGYTTRNILAGPIASPHDGRLLGVLELLNKKVGAFDALDEDLLTAFSQHVAVALDRTRLVAEIKRQEASRASLEIARQVQRGFMPSTLPEIPGYEVATWWFPNEAVGGDYCDVFPLRDGRTALVIADVSGHGLGPSLIMASVRAALRALALDHAATEVLLNLLAHALAVDLIDGRFITLVLAALDWRTHRVEYANAGHAPAMHYRAKTRDFVVLESTGLPLGVLDRPEYPQGPPVAMSVGDLLVLCTDGIVEAMNESDERFGQARLERIVRECAGRPVSELVQRVGAEVSAHYVGESPPDDLTILVVRRNE